MTVSVTTVSDPYANFMVNPAQDPPACPRCGGIPGPGYAVCYGCSFNPSHVDAVLPITYSKHMGQMHNVLRSYKADDSPERNRTILMRDLTAVLWRYLLTHEGCVAAAAGVASFEVVTTVPSSLLVRDRRPGGLREIVGRLCHATRERYVRALMPVDPGFDDRNFRPDRFRAVEDVRGRAVLLIDDTWTSGAKAQSAAYVLKEAGATAVGCVVIGRHMRENYSVGPEVLKAQGTFDWHYCRLRGAHG